MIISSRFTYDCHPIALLVRPIYVLNFDAIIKEEIVISVSRIRTTILPSTG
jgi:hypothetical protein